MDVTNVNLASGYGALLTLSTLNGFQPDTSGITGASAANMLMQVDDGLGYSSAIKMGLSGTTGIGLNVASTLQVTDTLGLTVVQIQGNTGDIVIFNPSTGATVTVIGGSGSTSSFGPSTFSPILSVTGPGGTASIDMTSGMFEINYVGATFHVDKNQIYIEDGDSYILGQVNNGINSYLELDELTAFGYVSTGNVLVQNGVIRYDFIVGGGPISSAFQVSGSTSGTSVSIGGPVSTPGKLVTLSYPGTTADVSQIFQTKNGTIALLSDITSTTPSTLFDYFTTVPVGIGGTGTFISSTIAANQLSTDGDKLILQYGGSVATAPSATTTLTFKMNGSTFLTTTFTSATYWNWSNKITFIRDSSSSLRFIATGDGVAVTGTRTVTGLTFSSTNIISIDAVQTGVSFTLQGEMGYLQYIPHA